MTLAGSLIVSTTAFPYGIAALAAFTQTAVMFFDDDRVPRLETEQSCITGERDIIDKLASKGGILSDGAQTDFFSSMAQSMQSTTSFQDAIAILNAIDDHLTFRTFLIGHGITATDWIVWGAMKGSLKALGILKNGQQPHFSRWFSFLENLSSTQALLLLLSNAKAAKARDGSKTASSFALGLSHAIKGEVVTRFPPEPSGYLHIGHAKAAMLNQYFAEMYNGKLIIRFDDTNPTKERTEFEETILEDLRLLGIHGDSVTHTSDYFEQLYQLALNLVKVGKAYADDTNSSHAMDIPCECDVKQHGRLSQMAHDRWHGLPSRRRDASIQENLKWFTEMKVGSEEGLKWCLRAKLSIDDPNKALRDPVIYRTNVATHHRTGNKWKIYPTYDFACPMVDSIEGVTHALRTNEYRDRNPQYTWMINATSMRQVHIWDFSRLNFIYTVLSKRKLHWFVDQALVSGWDDPRFPTVRGIRRRGMTVEAIRQFMLSQGPSQAVVSLEWDSIWVLNKKVIDPIAPRFWALSKQDIVPVTVKGATEGYIVRTQPKHKKNLAVGKKDVIYAPSIFVEQGDAASFQDQEEITLMSWGNAIVNSILRSPSGKIISVEVILNLHGDFQMTSKKVTWLAAPTEQYCLAEIALVDFDYLITKKKIEEGDNLQNFVTPLSEFREDAWADANVFDLVKGEIIQFERKGYYIFDGTGRNNRLEFIRIPDGKASSLARKVA
ncbi:tRNA synthetases class I, catalytic domain-containing protein [Crepidotus variabilis]|uniref:glutamate--tRNA ligase n=1 Tax=Crepidotus variabilis TaxID=179855 RepID=A0A9P6EDR9_9AGAR|nr:tRNA synthetases class I, catalytic domain-containing protein [Crepidotus variabilis]